MFSLDNIEDFEVQNSALLYASKMLMVVVGRVLRVGVRASSRARIVVGPCADSSCK